MKKLVLAAAIIATLSSTAHVTIAKNKTQGSGPQPYTDCGIGASLFPDTKWAAVSSNVIWDIGTTAVASATLSPETCKAKDATVAKYILDTYDNVVEETAIGEGEYVTAMLGMYGCDAAAHNNIISSIRSDFGEKLSESSYASLTNIQKAASYFNSLTSVVNNKYSSNCSA